MLPNNQNEGNSQGAAGAAEQPTSPTSAPDSQPLPDYVVSLQHQVADVQKLVQGIQKGTDKQIGQVRTDVKRILELQAQGLNETQINRELWIDQQMSGQQSAPIQPTAGSGRQDTGIDVESIVASLQFQPNDPALAALKIKYAGDPQGLIKAAADLRLAQVQTPNPSPATLPSQIPGNPPPPPSNVDVTALQQEQSVLMREPSKNHARLRQIREELKKAG